MFPQGQTDDYIVRWPLWFGGVLAIAVGGTVYAMLAAAVSRALRPIWLFVLAGLVACGFVGIAIADPSRNQVDRTALTLSTIACILAFAIAPALTIWASARPSSNMGYWKQVGLAVLSIYGTFVGLGLFVIAWALVYRLVT